MVRLDAPSHANSAPLRSISTLPGLVLIVYWLGSVTPQGAMGAVKVTTIVSLFSPETAVATGAAPSPGPLASAMPMGVPMQGNIRLPARSVAPIMSSVSVRLIGRA